MTAPPSWAREFARPLPVAAAGLLALNDHVLKGAGVLPGWVTGKLSDVAGLFFFPVLLFALASLVFGPPASRTLRAGALAATTAIVFALVKTVPAANAVACAVLGPTVRDPTDLVACPMVLASVAFLRTPPRPPSSRRGPTARDRVLVLLAAVASMATSPARPPQRGYPSWKVEVPRRDAGCSNLSAEVVKTGKEGLGVLVVREVEECDVVIERAVVRVGHAVVPAVAVPPWDSERTTYLGFVFDDERAWNEGIRHGTIELTVSSAGASRVLAYPMRFEYPGPHVPPLPRAVPPPPPPPSASSLPLAVPPAAEEAP